MRVGTFSNLDSTTLPYNEPQVSANVSCWCFPQVDLNTIRTNTVIDKLIMYAINRGAATSMIFFFASTQFYVISVTSMLITRDSLREELQKASDTNLALSTLQVFPAVNFHSPNFVRKGQVNARTRAKLALAQTLMTGFPERDVMRGWSETTVWVLSSGADISRAFVELGSSYLKFRP
ncbi:hypothetical protein FB451DRAFT_1177927 [Mycena latifolia]|nr:hypothetical protein FB451DRAFT_1177927 [Mycena latifolia]